MSEIKLINLTLTNFRGISELIFSPNGRNSNVFGKNGTGKTSIYNAFLWLLFDKDCEFKSSSVKTIGATGAETHGLNHTAEAELIHAGVNLKLKKVFIEQWTKKRGFANKEFTGHVTKYWIDDVPVKLKEYKEIVAAITDEETFKLLTSAFYFAKKLPWEKRRSIVLSVCGDVTNEEVISSSNDLSTLSDILGNHTLDEHKKIVKERKALINKELSEIPTRIDEANRTIAGIDQAEEAYIREKSVKLQDGKDEADKEYSLIENGGQDAELNLQMAKIGAELFGIKQDFDLKTFDSVKSHQSALAELDRVKLVPERKLSQATSNLESAKQDILTIEKIIAALRKEFVELSLLKFERQEDKSCEQCGQAIPEELQLASFNVWLSEEVKRINAAGKQNADILKGHKNQVEVYENEIISSNADIAEINRKTAQNDTDIKSLQAQSHVDTEEYKNAAKRKEMVQGKINLLTSNNDDADLLASGAKCDRLKLEIKEVNEQIAKYDGLKTTKKRIEELKAEERKLAKEFEKFESELFLVEEFTRRKVEMLEEKINSKFNLVRFKMFQEQINGGLSDCCVVTMDGKPYDQLSGGERVFAGADCITALAQHYGVFPPVFIDEAATVTLPIDLPGQQVIKLIASAKDDVLRVETI